MKIDILGVKIDKMTQEEVIAKIGEWLNHEDKHYIVTPNPEFVMWAQKDLEFKNILNQADLAIADGIGLLWAAKYLKLKLKSKKLKFLQAVWQMIYSGISLIFFPRFCRTILPERITGVDLVLKIAELAEQKNCSIYLLGARNNIAQMAAQKLREHFPKLKIAGALAGSPNQEADKKLQNILNQAKPEILLVAYGHPKQEKWIKRNLLKLKTVKMAIGVGGAFDFIAGKVKRAPLFFRKIGLEWLWRFLLEPKRARRIFTATWKFSWAVVNYKLKKESQL